MFLRWIQRLHSLIKEVYWFLDEDISQWQNWEALKYETVIL